MRNKEDEALALFNKGYNCAQSILATYCTSYSMDRETAFRVATGFGTGMGGLQDTCGLLTGAFMVIGLKYCMLTPDEPDDKNTGYKIIQQLAAEFKKKHNALTCRELTGYTGLSSDDELKRFADDPERAERCRACLKTVTSFIDENLHL